VPRPSGQARHLSNFSHSKCFWPQLQTPKQVCRPSTPRQGGFSGSVVVVITDADNKVKIATMNA